MSRSLRTVTPAPAGGVITTEPKQKADRIPLDYAEVKITRRLYRSGQG